MQRATRGAESARRRSREAASRDAIALLKSDHRQVESWFADFRKARTDGRKGKLAAQICRALLIHMTIEEETFYPAFLEATGDTPKHHEAEVEHAAAKKLIAEIADMKPGDDYYDARVKVLSEMIKHHVKEEEKPGGLFAEARKSGMDLDALGERLAERKAQLMGPGAHADALDS